MQKWRGQDKFLSALPRPSAGPYALEKLAHDLSKHLGPTFDEIFETVIDGPPIPVRENTRAFTDWIIAHNLKTWGLYSAYSSLSLQHIRALQDIRVLPTT